MRDSSLRTMTIAALLCVVCSVGVSVAAVKLRPVQEYNKALDKQKNILLAAGLYEDGVNIDQVFRERIRAQVVDLDSGSILPDVNAATVDERQLAKDPAQSIAIPPERDIAGIRRRAKIAVIYQVVDGESVQQVVLPVNGKGLWSTLYGFLAVDAEISAVSGIGFYEHAETPGLGGEVDNPRWRAIWKGKRLYDEQGELRIELVKSAVDQTRPEAIYQIDGLSGATLTNRGVHQLVRYWLGEDGFGKYLDRLRQGGGDAS